MSIILPEKLKLRTELLSELTHLELDQNQQYVANSWSPLRKYKEGMIVYIAEEDISVTGVATGSSAYALSWWRASVNHDPSVIFDISKWDPIGAQSLTGEVAVKDDDTGLLPTAAILLDFGNNLEVTMVGSTARIDVISGVATPWQLISGGSEIYYNDTVLIGTSTPWSSDKLQVQGGAWISGSITVGGLVDGVDLAAFKSNYDVHQHYISNVASSLSNITQISDVLISSLADEDILQYNSGTQRWENSSASVGAHALGDHTDVTISAPSLRQFLTFDGSNWINISVVANSTTGLSSPLQHNHDSLYYTQTNLQTSGGASVNWNNITGAPTGVPDDEPFLLAVTPVGTPLSNYRVLSSDTTINVADGGATANMTLSVVDRSNIQQVTIWDNSLLQGSYSNIDFVDTSTLVFDIAQTTGSDYISISADVVGLSDALMAIANSTFLTLTNDTYLGSERAITAGLGINFTDAGAGSTFTIAQTADSIRQMITAGLNNTEIGTSQPIINFIEGTEIDITVTEDIGNNRYDVTFNSLAESGINMEAGGVAVSAFKRDIINFIEGATGNSVVDYTIVDSGTKFNIVLDVTAPVNTVAGKTGDVTLRVNSDMLDVLVNPLDFNNGGVLAPGTNGIMPNVLIWDGINLAWRNRPADELFAIANNLSLNSLIDVEVSTTGSPPVDKSLLYFDFATQLWINGIASDVGLYSQADLDGGALDSLYYTQTALGSTGVASYVNWDKVFDYPAFALASQIKDYAYELLDVYDYNAGVAPTTGQVLVWQSGGFWAPATNSAVTSFLTLTDSPSSYAGESLKFVRVNAGETALEFSDVAASIEDLSDVQFATGDPQNDQVLKYNSISGKWEPSINSGISTLATVLSNGNTSGGTDIEMGTDQLYFGATNQSFIAQSSSNLVLNTAGSEIVLINSITTAPVQWHFGTGSIRRADSSNTASILFPTSGGPWFQTMQAATGTLALLDDVTTFTEITDGHLEYNSNTIAYLTDIPVVPATPSWEDVLNVDATADNMAGLVRLRTISGTDRSEFWLNGGQISIAQRDNSTGYPNTGILIANTGGQIYTKVSSGVEAGLYLSQTALSQVFKDDIYSKGLDYADDYSANFTARTLVDKEYVDNAVLTANEFTELTDTPNDYTGYADYLLKVNVGEDALEYGMIRDDGDNVGIGAAPATGVATLKVSTNILTYAIDAVNTLTTVSAGIRSYSSGVHSGRNMGIVGQAGQSTNMNIGIIGTGSYNQIDGLPSVSGGAGYGIVAMSENTSAPNYGFYTRLQQSNSSNNIGITVITGNVGAGTSYIGQFDDGRTTGIGKVLTDIDGNGLAEWSTLDLSALGITEITDGHLEYNGETIAYLSDIVNKYTVTGFAISIGANVVTHNLGTKAIIVSVMDESDDSEVDIDIVRTSINSITINSSAVIGAVTVTVIG